MASASGVRRIERGRRDRPLYLMGSEQGLPRTVARGQHGSSEPALARMGSRLLCHRRRWQGTGLRSIESPFVSLVVAVVASPIEASARRLAWGVDTAVDEEERERETRNLWISVDSRLVAIRAAIQKSDWFERRASCPLRTSAGPSLP